MTYRFIDHLEVLFISGLVVTTTLQVHINFTLKRQMTRLQDTINEIIRRENRSAALAEMANRRLDAFREGFYSRTPIDETEETPDEHQP